MVVRWARVAGACWWVRVLDCAEEVDGACGRGGRHFDGGRHFKWSADCPRGDNCSKCPQQLHEGLELDD